MRFIAALIIIVGISLSAAESASPELRPYSSQEKVERIRQAVSAIEEKALLNDSYSQIDACIAACATKLGIPATPKNQPLMDTISEAQKIAHEKSLLALPVPSQKSLEDEAAIDVPIYQIGDEIDCLYSPFLQINLKGRISALGRARFKVQNKEYLIADVMDQKVRDGLQPDRVVLLRKRFIANKLEALDALQKKWQSAHLGEINDALCRENEAAGFVSSPDGWVSLAQAVRTEFQGRKAQILAEHRRAAEKAAKQAAEEKAEAQSRRLWMWVGGSFASLLLLGCSIGAILHFRSARASTPLPPPVANSPQSRQRN